jgi:MFS family permease
MLQVLYRVLTPIVSLIIICLGNSFFQSFISLFLMSHGSSNFIIGLAGSSYYLGFLIGSVRAEKMIIRIGFIRSFTTFAALFTAGIMFNALYTSPLSCILIRFVIGFCIAGLFVVVESWLLLFSTKKTQGKILSFYMIALYSATATAQYILPLVDINSIVPFAIVVILSSLSIVPLSLTRKDTPNLDKPSYLSPKELFKASPYGFFNCITGGIVLSSFYSLGPIFAKAVSQDINQVAQILGLTMFGGLILQWPIGYLSDIFDRRIISIIVSLLCCLSSIGLAIAFEMPIAVIYAIAIIFGGFSFTIYPLGVTLASDRLDSKHLVAATAMLLVTYGIGCIMGPLAAPVFMKFFGPSGLFVFSATFCLLLTIYGIINYFIKPAILPEEKTEYIVMPRTTPVASNLDPRANENQTHTPNSDQIPK